MKNLIDNVLAVVIAVVTMVVLSMGGQKYVEAFVDWSEGGSEARSYTTED